MEPSLPQRALAIRRAAARLCLRLGWAPLHEVTLPNGRRADILALRADGGFACIEVKSGPRDFLTDAKWHDYSAFADELFFAIDVDFPQDLLPVEVGVIVVAGLEAELLRAAPGSHWPEPAADRSCTVSHWWRLGVSQHLRTRPGWPICGRRCGWNDMGRYE